MLTESKHIKQIEGEPFRRWFSDDYFDLIVCNNDSGEIIRFELCYGKSQDEHVLTWGVKHGYGHHRVDDGENEPGRYKMAPIFVSDGFFDWKSLADRFSQESKSIDLNIAKFVQSKITDYSSINLAELTSNSNLTLKDAASIEDEVQDDLSSQSIAWEDVDSLEEDITSEYEEIMENQIDILECSNCGAKLKTSFVFCPFCQSPLDASCFKKGTAGDLTETSFDNEGEYEGIKNLKDDKEVIMDPSYEEKFHKNAVSAPVRALVGFVFVCLLSLVLFVEPDEPARPLVENFEDLSGLLMLIFLMYVMGWMVFFGKIPDWMMGILKNSHKKQLCGDTSPFDITAKAPTVETPINEGLEQRLLNEHDFSRGPKCSLCGNWKGDVLTKQLACKRDGGNA